MMIKVVFKTSYLRPKPKRKVTDISKLISSLSQSLLGRENQKSLLRQIHVGQKNLINFIKERRTIKLLHLFRSYSALIVVISSALLVSTTNISAGKESSGFLFGYLGSTEDNYENPLEKKLFVETDKKKGVAMAPIAQASTSPDPTIKIESEEVSLITMEGQALIAGTSPVRKDPKEDDGVEIYEVQQGDTVNAIALAHHISVNTILWANEIDNVDSIMPGDKIFILPASGLSYTVQKKDDIDSIASKYKADKGKIISFNDLPANGELKEGQEIIIPDGQKEITAPAPTNSQTPGTGSAIATRPYESFGTAGKNVSAANGNGHKFPYGYCTWYVASKKHVPWSGNAGTWLYNAKSMGYATGKTPKVGAIMVSSESWWGHVGIVESVNGKEFTISEMNYKGFAKKSTRTISTGTRVVKGFIY